VGRGVGLGTRKVQAWPFRSPPSTHFPPNFSSARLLPHSISLLTVPPRAHAHSAQTATRVSHHPPQSITHPVLTMAISPQMYVRPERGAKKTIANRRAQHQPRHHLVGIETSLEPTGQPLISMQGVYANLQEGAIRRAMGPQCRAWPLHHVQPDHRGYLSVRPAEDQQEEWYALEPLPTSPGAPTNADTPQT
jgi:hypothetical protein